jgi:peptidoglycan/LPS O-acetylase OafA/YrhL
MLAESISGKHLDAVRLSFLNIALTEGQGMTNVDGIGRQRGSRLANPVRLTGWSLIATLLLAPAVAMRFTEEVSWTAFDFLIAAALLIGAGLALELVVWRVRSVRARIAIAIAVLAVVLLVWAQGAVGIF